MATIRTAISLYDGVSGPLRTMHRAMNVVMDSFEALNTASSGAIDVSSIRQARAELSGVMSDFPALRSRYGMQTTPRTS